MNIKKQLKRQVGKKATRRIYKALPWVGGAVVAMLGSSIANRGLQQTLDNVRDFSGNAGRRENE